ncbi:M13 family metallopeptidase [Pelomonas sp. APW6]|uniref:M13 family metallopeptidase n=1 Tax=Roseateles subflavus TaxID=3053353 RepID=A0ABT7LCI7_9BURK|nr:M13 family metallopeptidase [Pelomonas sp. APW6]MDL5030577.1 M13 family metallopeptidase [Pelomonas sp. APW6]
MKTARKTARSAWRLSALGAALAFATLAQAQETKPAEQPLERLPYTPSLDLSAMDRSADPCEDLYQYACGGWNKNNPIPDDQARWSVYAKAANDNQRYLWGILAKLAEPAAAGETRTESQTKIGDYFAACMDETAVAQKGLAALKPLMDRINGLKDKSELPFVLAALHQNTHNGRFFFSFGAGQDFADSTRQIAFAGTGGLSLPERDYYLKTDAKSRELRAKFQAHVARTFELLGDPAPKAAAQARLVLAVETALAKASLSVVDKRDPYKSFHRFNGKQLQALIPDFDFAAYQSAQDLAPQNEFNVSEPAFYKALAQQWKRLSVADLRTMLRWQLASSMSPYLGPDFVNENFAFFSNTLHGVPKQQARWKKCVTLVDGQLGEALGQEFVARNFSPELKAATQRMTEQIEVEMGKSIRALPWMSEDTKKRALEKLHSIVNKVGYPDQWRDYGRFTVLRGDFVGNVMRGQAFERHRDLAKIGQPLDRGEWGMTPQTVNAYYNAQMNDINFPAGVLQPPLYDAKMDDAPNYGNTGGTIGHELVHGFDDEGRQFDAKGNLKDWWTKKDAKAFEQRAACVSKQYAQYKVIDDIRINSKLTLGEDLADLGGLVLAWAAWQTQIAGKQLPAADGLTPEQRFFVGFAQWDCSDTRPEAARVHAATDPHSPGRYRINGVAVNMPEFEKAFACKPGQAMVKPAAERCKVW